MARSEPENVKLGLAWHEHIATANGTDCHPWTQNPPSGGLSFICSLMSGPLTSGGDCIPTKCVLSCSQTANFIAHACAAIDNWARVLREASSEWAVAGGIYSGRDMCDVICNGWQSSGTCLQGLVFRDPPILLVPMRARRRTEGPFIVEAWLAVDPRRRGGGGVWTAWPPGHDLHHHIHRIRGEVMKDLLSRRLKGPWLLCAGGCVHEWAVACQLARLPAAAACAVAAARGGRQDFRVPHVPAGC